LKLNVHVLGAHVGVLEQVGDFKSVMSYLPNVASDDSGRVKVGGEISRAGGVGCGY